MSVATEAAPKPITHARVWAIAGPIVISNATIPILGAVDTGVVGQLGDPVPIGAVGIGAIILSAVYWVFGFLRMGTVGLTSQALGAGDRGEADALLSRALLIGFAGGALLIVLQSLIFAGGFALSPASDAVETLARDYMEIRIWSAPAAIAIYGITGWLIAAERTRAVLVLQVAMNGVNILLDLVFVLGFDWGVEGVAVATLIAEWSGLLLGLWFCRDAFLRPYWNDMVRVLDRVRLWHMAAVNRDILIRSLLLEAIFVSFLFFGADFGDVQLAANQVLLQFLHIVAFGLDGFAFAAETLVGNAMGRRSPERVRRSALMTSGWGLAVALAFAAVIALAGGVGIDIMTTSEPVRAAARDLLPWMVAAPLLGVAAYMLDGIFIGATRTRDMRNMMLISAAIYAVAVWLLVPRFGNDGLWMALLISLAARAVSLGLRYPALERAAAD
ncbi:MATE family efflux transporter [Alphaproteobacteria bacterium GH1-50]|uniref:MATE family efflux transporter n=1 Tax=Kangsaoukella pontilimi TaxID=2691042 RepID=A0A7C9II95_9RHOB|nr:MATE family efflux transporter [Kangsaoukella pontilimi]MXQ09608.1 MATE family efflux transporter [Kangsaoukella pontilimi]